jgi:hypothetical protein
MRVGRPVRSQAANRAPTRRFEHPEVGTLELNCQTLLDPEQSHRLLVYTAEPGSESYEKLQLLAVIGDRM